MRIIDPTDLPYFVLSHAWAGVMEDDDGVPVLRVIWLAAWSECTTHCHDIGLN